MFILLMKVLFHDFGDVDTNDSLIWYQLRKQK